MADLSGQLFLVSKLFLLMLLGVLLRKKEIIQETGEKTLSGLILNAVLPCSILMSFLGEVTPQKLWQSLDIFLLSLGIHAASYLLARFLYQRCQPEHRSVMKYATICSNSGTMGTPVAEGLFGMEGVFLSAIFLIPLRIAMWTLGIAFFTGTHEKGVFRRTLTHPCIVAVLLGIVLMLTRLPLPNLVTDCLRTVGNCNAALSMILIGSIMSRMDLRLLWHRDTLFYTAVRLVLLPAGVLLACLVLELPPMVRNVSVILTVHHVHPCIAIWLRRALCLRLHSVDHRAVLSGGAAVVPASVGIGGRYEHEMEPCAWKYLVHRGPGLYPGLPAE